MKKEFKNGFTLVELLAVIVVIGLIASLAAVGITSVINSSKRSTHNQQVANIEKAAREWAVEHTEQLPNNDNDSINVTIEQLIADGKLTGIPKDPATGGEMSGRVIISCTNNCVSYTYKYVEP